MNKFPYIFVTVTVCIMFFATVIFATIQNNYQIIRQHRVTQILMPPKERKLTTKSPNSCGQLVIELKNDESFWLNSNNFGKLDENVQDLEKVIRETLQMRRENVSVTRQNLNAEEALSIGELVIIKAPLSTKYAKVQEIIDILKNADVNYISLQLLDLPK